MTLKSLDAVKVITVRGTAFEAVSADGGNGTSETSKLQAFLTFMFSLFIMSGNCDSVQHSKRLFL